MTAPPAPPLDDATLDALRLAAAAVLDIAFALAVGALAGALSLARAASPWRAARLGTTLRLLGWATAAALVADLALLWIQAMGMAEVGPMAGLVEARSAMVSTRFGHAWLAGFAALVLLGVVRLGLRRGEGDLHLVALFACAVFAFARASTSHAGIGSFAAGTLAMAAHLLATGAWAGGVVAATLVLREEVPGAGPDAAWVRALSTTATVALAVVVASGIAAGLLETHGSLAPLAGSRWGFVLDAKLALVAVAVALGGFNRLVAMPPLLEALARGDGGPAQRRFARVLRAEAAVLLAVLVAAAVLAGGEPPPMAGADV